MHITKFWLRVCGLAGILGGLLLFSGDMLLYYNGDSANLLTNMGKSSDYRITLSALFALFSSWLYLVGIIPVFYAFKPAKTTVRNIIALSFSFIGVGYGVIHGAYIAIATSAKLATEHNFDINTGAALALDANNLMRLFIYPFFAILSWLFITHVWKKNTLYPRWIIFFFPLTLFSLQFILNPLLTGQLRVIFMGGFYNLIMVIFFTASSVALWNTSTE